MVQPYLHSPNYAFSSVFNFFFQLIGNKGYVKNTCDLYMSHWPHARKLTAVVNFEFEQLLC